MSQTIDERVLSMELDNSNFERNAEQSINTLNRLDDSMRFENASKGLSQMQAFGRTFDLSNIISSVEAVSHHFSAMEVAAATAVANITNRVMNMGERLVKSLSVDQISAGWEKFGQKTTSVATLVSQGYDLSVVNKELERLNWFTDETSYNFTDMVGNIGKFTASGQELDKSVTAMEGIALWAARSGQNASTASRAMYQLSQAMSKKALKYDDYKSIQNANMDTKEFRENAVAAAEALGVLKKNADDTYTIIKDGSKTATFDLAGLFTSDALSRHLWFNDEVMMGVFNRYSGAVNKLYSAVEEGRFDTASEAIAGMKDELDEFELGAFKAGQEARTFRDVIDSVKDAVSTGWMNTFQNLIGDYAEATKLWTDMANELWDVFASGGEYRNEVLKEWKEAGGREDLLEGLSTFYNGVKELVEPFKEAWGEIFPAYTADTLLNISSAIKNFSESVTGFFMPVDQEEITEMAIAAKGFNREEEKGAEAIKAYTKSELDDRLEKEKSKKEAIEYGEALKVQRKHTEQLQNTVKGIATVFRSFLSIGKKVYSVFSDIFMTAWDKAIYPVIEWALDWASSMGTMVQTSEKFGNAISYIKGELEKLGTFVGDKFDKIIDYFKRLRDTLEKNGAFKKLGESFKSLRESLESLYEPIRDTVAKIFSLVEPYLPSVETVSDIIKDVADAIAWVIDLITPGIDKVKEFFETFSNTDSTLLESVLEAVLNFGTGLAEFAIGAGGKAIESVSVIFEKFSGAVDKVEKTVEGPLSKFTSTFAEKLGLMKENSEVFTLENFKKAIFDVVKVLIGVGAIGFFFNLARSMLAVANIPNAFVDVIDGVSESLYGFAKKQSAEAVLKIAEAIGILAGCLVALTFVDQDNLKTAVAAMAVMLLLFSKVVKDMLGIGKKGEELTSTDSGVFGFFTTLTKAFDKVKSVLSKGAGKAGFAAFAVALASAIGILVGVLAKIVNFDWEGSSDKIWVAVGVISALGFMVTLAATMFSRFSKNNIKIGDAIFVVALAAAIKMIVGSLVSLMGVVNGENWDAAQAALGSVIAIMAALAVIIAVASRMGGKDGAKTGQLLGMSVMVMAIAAAIKTLSSAVSELSTGNMENIWSGVFAVITLMFSLSGALKLLSKDKAGVSNVAGILAMAGGIYIAVQAISQIADMIGSIGLEKTIAATAIVGVMGALITGLVKWLSTMKASDASSYTKSIIGFVAISASLGLIASAIAKVAAIGNMTKMAESAGALTLVMFAIVGAANMLKNVDPKKSALNFLAIGVSLKIIASAFSEIATIDGNLMESVMPMVAAIGAFVAIAAVMGAMHLDTAMMAVGAGLAAFGAGALLLSAALYVLGEAIPKLMDALVYIGKTIMEHGKELIVTIGVILAAVVAAIVAFNPWILTAITLLLGTAFNAFVAFLMGNLPVMLTTLLFVLATLAGFLRDSMPGMVGMVLELIWAGMHAIADGIREQGPQLLYAVLDIIDAILDMVVEAIAQIMGSFGFLGQAFADWVRGSKDWFDPDTVAPEEVTSKIDESVSQTSQNIQNSNANTSQSLDELRQSYDQVGASAENAGNGVDIFNKYLGQYTDNTGFEEYMNGLGISMGEAGENGPYNFQQGWLANEGQIINTVQETSDEALDAADMHDKMVPIGENAATGLAEGIERKMYLVDVAANKMAALVPAAARRTLQVQSPSKVLFGIGEFADEGLSNGIDSSAYTVEDSVTRMCENGLRAASSFGSAMTGIIGMNGMSPTIRPVVDSSSVARAGYFINSQFEDKEVGIKANIDRYSLGQEQLLRQQLAESKIQNEALIHEIGTLREYVSNVERGLGELGTKIGSMQVSLDGKALVGQIVDPIDKRLGRIASRRLK